MELQELTHKMHAIGADGRLTGHARLTRYRFARMGPANSAVPADPTALWPSP
jgi:hypothetical protein